MATSNDNAVNEALRNTDRTIVRLKEVLEQVLQMRVEVAKLEFDLLELYHTICPEELEFLRDDLQNVNIFENDGSQELINN